MGAYFPPISMFLQGGGMGVYIDSLGVEIYHATVFKGRFNVCPVSLTTI